MTAKTVTKVDWKKIEPKVDHDGEKIILPERPTPMSEEEAIKHLERVIKAKNTVFAVHEEVRCHFFDGLVAFNMALKERYGVTFSEKTPPKHFFDTSHPPVSVNVKCGPNPKDIIQVAYGRFSIPNVEGQIETGFGMHKASPF
jgi:hypothetical protein